MTLALICSGQGNIDRGMFDLVASAPEAQPILWAAKAVLGADPIGFCRTAAEPALHANREGQILCVARALALTAAVFPQEAPAETLVAGYSVGEMAAWGVAGIWSAEATFELVDRRARAMDAASGPDDCLGYVRGLPRQSVERLAGRYGCALAIANPQLLFIVGGDRAAIEALCTAALEEGATRAGLMRVHVASHTPRLAAAVIPFAEALGATPMRRPRMRLMSASGAASITDPSRALKDLARQVAETIDWADLLDALAERGVTKVLELGPGRALAEMMSAMLPSAKARAVDEFHTLEGVRAWLATS